MSVDGGMIAETPLPRDPWDQITPAVQAAVLALRPSLERRIAALEAQL
ncbi:hypothetical protein EP7_004748 [Isosphaeraceae bacterium EP7]